MPAIGSSTGSSHASKGGNPLSSMIVILVLISALAGGLYLVMQYFKKKSKNSDNPDKKKVGDDVLPLPPVVEPEGEDGANEIPKGLAPLPEPVIAFDESEQ